MDVIRVYTPTISTQNASQNVTKWYNDDKGFGFILVESDEAEGKPEDLFVHYTQITGVAKGFRSLRKGEEVEFNIRVDDNGKPLFTQDDIESLAEKNADIIDRLHSKCQEICGMAADSVEVAEKN